MTKAMRFLPAVLGVMLLTAVLIEPAYGFFPKGGYNLTQQLRYATWPFREFDTNENGTIETGEGLEFRIESGPRGFTNAEIEQVKQGFQVWQDVPSSYAAFRFVGSIEDPMLPGAVEYDYLPMVFMQVENVAGGAEKELAPGEKQLGEVPAVEGDEEEGGVGGYTQPDEADYLAPGLDAYMPAITFLTYAIDTTVIELSGREVIIPAGTILDCDIVVNAAVHRAELLQGTTFGTLDLQATIAHHVGQLLGLAYTPLSNLDPFSEITLDSADMGLPVEPAVLQLTGTDGIRRALGATPTMFPIYFLTEMPSGAYAAGWRDLAPDDISGVTWLYPREDGLENFFSMNHEARRQVRETTGVPSEPISGAHIVAWASLSENDTDTRVPLFSTMSGLYQKSSNVQLQGRFNLLGLWKQMEIYGSEGGLYQPSYVITMNPLNGLGYDRQAPPDLTADEFDSLQGAFPISYSLNSRETDSFSTNYASEVFNEYGNIYGIDNNTAGTPLVWDFSKNTVVSKASGETLPAILPRNTPMFGDADVVCPMNIIETVGGDITTDDAESVLDGAEGLLNLIGIKNIGGDGGGPGGADGSGGASVVFSRLNTALRSFRDRVLLESAVGTAVVDAYYHMAPYLARQLLRHDMALRAARNLIIFGAKIGEYGRMIITMALCMCLILAGLRRLHSRAAKITLTALCLYVSGISVAFAGQMPITTTDLVAKTDYIFTGEVLSAEGQLRTDGRIYTDVVVKVRDVVKGSLNQDSLFTFSVIGGRYGNLVTAVSGMPGFTKGDQALMYFRDTERFGVVPFGGYRSKVPIILDPETGEEMLEGESGGTDTEGESEGTDNAEGEANQGKDAKSVSGSSGPNPPRETAEGFVPLEEYLDYLRALVRSQR